MFSATLDALKRFLIKSTLLESLFQFGGLAIGSLTLLTMVENAGKIVSQIVDSAPFKQNRFAPTTLVENNPSK